MRVDGFVSQFPKHADMPLVRFDFARVPSLSFLQQLVGAPADDLLYEEFELDDAQVAKLAPLLTRQPDTTRYVYFLSCEQADA